MKRSLALPVLLLLGCAEVPAAVCFADEPCADAGNTGAGGGSGGGDPDGGTGGGTGGGGMDGGPAVPNVFPLLGIPDTWAAVLATLPAVAPTPPALSVSEVTLSGGITRPSGCPEAFRGVVALPDGRALAIPFCTNRFAVISPAELTVEWIGPPLPAVSQPTDPGNFGGAVFGCDGRVYALPHHDRTQLTRITLEADGGFTFDDLPLSSPGPHLLAGGVIARPCSQGFRIIAAGAGGLFALDPTETNVTVTPIAVAAASVHFTSVARLGDAEVISATPSSGSNLLTVRVDSNTLLPTSGNSSLQGPHLGIATLRSLDAFVVTDDGWGFPILPTGPGTSRNLASARQRWPTNSLRGWVFSAGEDLLAWRDGTQPPADALLFGPAVSDAAGFTSGGLVMTTRGTLVSVPATTQRNVITLYEPVVAAPPGVVALSPWFNKL